MSLTPPTTAETTANIVSQIEAKLSATVPLLPKAFTRVLAAALAGVMATLYKYAGFIFLQLFIRHATIAETTINGKVVKPLVEKGREIGLDPPEPQPGTRAQLGLAVTVLEQTGTLPAQSKVLWSQTGVVYQTTAPVQLNAAIVLVGIVAISDPDGGDGSGVVGNAPGGTVLEFANPPAQVARQALVTNSVVQGADAETEEEYRERLLQFSQKRPQGGAYADYLHWGLTVPNVVAIYPYTADLPGEVHVYVEVDTDTDPDGIPDSAKLTEVFDAIDLDNQSGLATRRPAGSAVTTKAITRTEFDVEITGLKAPDLATTKSAVEQGIEEYLRSREPYIVGLSLPPTLALVTRSEVAGVVAQIVHAALGSFTTLVVSTGAESFEIYELGFGEKAKTGSVSYV